MTSVGPREWRDWCSVLPGDVAYDGAGRPWRVERAVLEPGSQDGDGAAVIWAELRGGTGGAELRTLRIPDSCKRVEMSEGPGHGVRSASDEALTWAMALVADRLGGRLMDAPGA